MWARYGRWILPEMPDFHVAFRNLLRAVNLRHGTDGFTSPPKEGVLRIFSPWKIRLLRPGLNPRTLGTKSQHATSRPPKPWDNISQMYFQKSGTRLLKIYVGRYGVQWLLFWIGYLKLCVVLKEGNFLSSSAAVGFSKPAPWILPFAQYVVKMHYYTADREFLLMLSCV